MCVRVCDVYLYVYGVYVCVYGVHFYIYVYGVFFCVCMCMARICGYMVCIGVCVFECVYAVCERVEGFTQACVQSPGRVRCWGELGTHAAEHRAQSISAP